jgi:hypothetical protein
MTRRDESAKRMRKLVAAVEATGRAGRIHGLTGGCSDCHADGALVLLPGGIVIAEVAHDDGCPTLTGAVAWRPVPLDEGESA